MGKSKKITKLQYFTGVKIKCILIFALTSVSYLSSAQKLKWTVYNQNTKAIYTETDVCPSDYPKNTEDGNYSCFKNYTVKKTDFAIKPDRVFQVVQSQEADTLWFASSNGVARLFDFNWKIFNTTNSDLPDNRVSRLIQKDDFGLIASTSYGIRYFGKKNEINTNMPEDLRDLGGACLLDKSNTLWIGGDNGLWKTDGTDYTQWINVTDNNSDLPINSSANVVYIYEHKKTGHIWIYVKNKGIFEYDGSHWKGHTSIPAFSSDGFVNPPCEDNQGNIWIGTSEGLYVYDGSTWKELTTLNTSVKSNFIKYVFEDSRKNIWIVTENDISVFDGNGWYSYDMTDVIGRTNAFRQLMIEDQYGKIWMAARTGLLLFDGYKWTKFTKENSPLPHNEIYSLYKDRDNNIWVGSLEGLSCIQQEGVASPIPYTVSGYTFLDKTTDELWDSSSEPAIPGRKLLLLPANTLIYSNNLGYYVFHVSQPGTYTIKSIDDNNFTSSKEYTFTVTGGFNTNLNIPYQSGAVKADTLTISATRGFPRCNGSINYWLDIRNQGTSDFNGDLTFGIDPVYTFIGADNEPSEITNNEVRWNNLSIPSFSNKQIKLMVNLPGIEHMNDDVQFDIEANNNLSGKTYTSQIVHKLFCAYDPNDKSVLPDREEILQTDELEYLIRFQNTGNDTAFTVVLKDTISALLERGSIEIISSSHSCQTTLDLASGEMIVTFNNILLPDDKINEPGSHGFVKYKASLKKNVPLFSEIKNTAYIYFDRNPAIVTNTINQVLVEEIITGIPESLADKNIIAFPNPAKELLHFQDREGKVLLFNQLGKLVAEGNAEVPLNVAGLSDGMYFLHQVKQEGTTVQKIEIQK